VDPIVAVPVVTLHHEKSRLDGWLPPSLSLRVRLLLLYHPQHGVLPVVLCFQADQLSVGMAAATLYRGSRRICTHIPLCPLTGTP